MRRGERREIGVVVGRRDLHAVHADEGQVGFKEPTSQVQIGSSTISVADTPARVWLRPGSVGHTLHMALRAARRRSTLGEHTRE